MAWTSRTLALATLLLLPLPAGAGGTAFGGPPGPGSFGASAVPAPRGPVLPRAALERRLDLERSLHTTARDARRRRDAARLALRASQRRPGGVPLAVDLLELRERRLERARLLTEDLDERIARPAASEPDARSQRRDLERDIDALRDALAFERRLLHLQEELHRRERIR